MTQDVSIIDAIDQLIALALNERASDIHIVPGADRLRVRFRIDGVLRDERPFPKVARPEIVSRIKIMAGLRTDEHQAAQDGRFRIASAGAGPVDVRVSVIPTHHGENAVLRLLPDHPGEFSLQALGFSRADREKIARAAARPQGMIVVAGPTGSGKTTTLYSLLKTLDTGGVSITTIEDPIECALDSATQVAVHSRAGMTFANGLRAVLRQDPDIIMVGEIRDAETAGLAAGAALTGHKVLTTLHANGAPAALLRLLDLGIEPYLVASAVGAVIGQRLLRRLCERCRRRREITAAELRRLREMVPDAPAEPYFMGAGCDHCRRTGYRGRMAVSEAMVMDDAMREAVLCRADAAECARLARRQGMAAMIESGLARAREGGTSIEEIIRIFYG